MLDLGYIRRSTSSWASPLHMVPKKNGDWRPCGDFQKLNDKTEADCDSISLLQNCTAFLTGKKVYSKIDIKCSFCGTC